MVYGWLKNVRAFFYPPTCLLCQAPGMDDLDLCAACRVALPGVGDACPRCALPLPADGGLCGVCQRRPPAFDAAAAAFRYAPPVDHLVQRLKFQGKLTHARLLGHLLAEHARAAAVDLPDCIVPVPLHYRRLRERGFNQARELAREVGRRLDVRVDTRGIVRIKHTDPQMALPAKVRRRNVRGAFRVRADFNARHVALLDDVITTGSTMEELARTLKRAGVERVQVWSCARAV